MEPAYLSLAAGLAFCAGMAIQEGKATYKFGDKSTGLQIAALGVLGLLLAGYLTYLGGK